MKTEGFPRVVMGCDSLLETIMCSNAHVGNPKKNCVLDTIYITHTHSYGNSLLCLSRHRYG